MHYIKLASTIMTNMIAFVSIVLGASASRALSRTLEEATMSENHAEWMAFHGRAYENDTEMERRSKIFKENVDFIEKFNSEGNNTYKLGINEFADLTHEEFLASHTGHKRPSLPRTPRRSFRYENMTEVPPRWDWRERGAVTPVKSQGGCGCCWAFSAVAALEGLTQIRYGPLITLSEQEILDCDGKNNGCNGGSMPDAFDFVIRNYGLTSAARYPYIAAKRTCNAMRAAFPAAQITGYENVPNKDENALLMAVANQPVSVAVDASLLRFYTSGIITGECGLNLNHALTVIGYGEDENGLKYWIFKNSWGARWGENGYVRMLRDSGSVEGICGIAMFASYPTAYINTT